MKAQIFYVRVSMFTTAKNHESVEVYNKIRGLRKWHNLDGA